MTDTTIHEELVKSAKQALNALYGRGVYESKTITYDVSDNVRRNLHMNMNYNFQNEVYAAMAKLSNEALTAYETTDKDENWVWVTGYKGLDKDMKAYNDFQYELDKLYIMPEGEPVKACSGGYHLCLNLEDLYNYKVIGNGNRFFECKALVRESDLKEYGKAGYLFKKNKLAAKSIHLTRELSIDEILDHKSEAGLWPQYIKEMAINKSMANAKKEWKIVRMTHMGYARPLAEYIVNDRNADDGYKLAVALDAQEGISMDTKVGVIFSHI